MSKSICERLNSFQFSKILLLILFVCLFISLSFQQEVKYIQHYKNSIHQLSNSLLQLQQIIKEASNTDANEIQKIKNQIHVCRSHLKKTDFWLRYLDPILYKLINGPLIVEWETEVFEKFELPYRRQGAGLTLAEEYIQESAFSKDSLLTLIDKSVFACSAFLADSFLVEISKPPHFYFANRLYLLNLNAIYTTGFECPDSFQIIPELKEMISATRLIYSYFNQNFSSLSVSEDYLILYEKMNDYCKITNDKWSEWNHFEFVKSYVNPLFSINQKSIQKYNLRSQNYNDYSLNDLALSVTDKKLFKAQNTKGIYENIMPKASLWEDEKILTEIKELGRLLFYDPILSSNNKRSCASCHKPTQFFTDTLMTTPLQLDGNHFLPRNTISLINANHNHLMMMDGKHISLESQAEFVMKNPIEMGSIEAELVRKVLSCNQYKNSFNRIAKLLNQPSVTIENISSALISYYSDFSFYLAPFDLAIQNKITLEDNAVKGFNLFMGKAKCGTCHFPPVFNGVKPPYINSEFEVIGIAEDSNFVKLSADDGRYLVHPVPEMKNAFRTPTIRNTAFTKPYMHNGSLSSLKQIIDFYDAGGGIGKGLKVNNQTLSSDSLKLSPLEVQNILAFIISLNENIEPIVAPDYLPLSKDKILNKRKVGGEY